MSRTAKLLAQARVTAPAARLLVGQMITKIRYMTDAEVADLGWNEAALVIELENGHLLHAARDDEGNDAGALFTTSEEIPVIPTWRDY